MTVGNRATPGVGVGYGGEFSNETLASFIGTRSGVFCGAWAVRSPADPAPIRHSSHQTKWSTFVCNLGPVYLSEFANGTNCLGQFRHLVEEPDRFSGEMVAKDKQSRGSKMSTRSG